MGPGFYSISLIIPMVIFPQIIFPLLNHWMTQDVLISDGISLIS